MSVRVGILHPISPQGCVAGMICLCFFSFIYFACWGVDHLINLAPSHCEEIDRQHILNGVTASEITFMSAVSIPFASSHRFANYTTNHVPKGAHSLQKNCLNDHLTYLKLVRARCTFGRGQSCLGDIHAPMSLKNRAHCVLCFEKFGAEFAPSMRVNFATTPKYLLKNGPHALDRSGQCTGYDRTHLRHFAKEVAETLNDRTHSNVQLHEFSDEIYKARMSTDCKLKFVAAAVAVGSAADSKWIFHDWLHSSGKKSKKAEHKIYVVAKRFMNDNEYHSFFKPLESSYKKLRQRYLAETAQKNADRATWIIILADIFFGGNR